MKSLESIETAVFGVPTRRDVLERLRRDEPCRADLLSCFCTFASGRNDYLLRDMPGIKVCERCPLFERTWQKLTSDWEEWVLAMQDVLT